MNEHRGEVLRNYREATGFSQTGLARAAGIDPAYVNRFERGFYTLMSRTVILALARALGLPARERDTFLYRMGHAPEEDWQARAELAESRLLLIRNTLREIDDEV